MIYSISLVGRLYYFSKERVNMRKKMLMAGAVVLTGVALVAAAGCGSSTPQAQNPPKTPASSPGSGGSNTFSQQIDALKKTAMTVTETQNGKITGKWTQGSDGSWRWDAEDGSSNSVIIFNASQNKTWTIDGNTATESTLPATAYEGFNPAMMLAVFAYVPGTGSGDTREYSANGSKLTVELKGPNGLPSKATSVDASNTTVWTFDYSSVPSSTFDLPSGMTVQTVPGLSGGGTDTIPGGGSAP